MAQAWLIGANPRLSGRTPAECIREFDAPSVIGAFTAFYNGEEVATSPTPP